MATATLRSSTAPEPAVSIRQAIARHATRLKEIASWVRMRISRSGEQPEFVQEVARKVFNDRSAALEHVVTLVVDAAHRGSLDEARAIGEQLIAIAQAEWGAAHPNGEITFLSRKEASIAEQAAQSAREESEGRMKDFPCLSNYMRFLADDAAYNRARRMQVEAVRREVACA